MNYKVSFNQEVDGISIRTAISYWSGEVCTEMLKFQDEWFIENMRRWYGYMPSIDRLKIDNDGWTYREIQSYDCNFKKQLWKDEKLVSTLTMSPVYLTNYYFRYKIENDDGFETEGMR